MEEKPSHSYIIQGGDIGAERLEILAKIMWPFTRPFLLRSGLMEGMKCLDLGCGNGELSSRILDIVGPSGHVTGIDFDPSIIKIAREKHKAENIHFLVMDIEREELPANAFDFIFCRFILSHLQDPLYVLQKLKRALRPRGIIAIEDVDFAGHFCYPPCAAFEKYVSFYTALSLKRGANPFLGSQLLPLVSAAGFIDLTINVVLPAFRDGEGKQIALLTLQAIQESIITEKLASPLELDEMIKELALYSNADLTLMSMPRISQVSAY